LARHQGTNHSCGGVRNEMDDGKWHDWRTQQLERTRTEMNDNEDKHLP
jgi:hypothetical protein